MPFEQQGENEDLRNLYISWVGHNMNEALCYLSPCKILSLCTQAHEGDKIDTTDNAFHLAFYQLSFIFVATAMKILMPFQQIAS